MLDYYGIDSTQYGVCHSDELYMFWNPYGGGNYDLNEVSDLEWFRRDRPEHRIAHKNEFTE